MIGQLSDSQIKLKRIFIASQLPPALEPLHDLAMNLWWSWNPEATALFNSIDPDKFQALQYNPVALLDNLSPETAGRLAADKDFLARLKSVDKAFRAYMAEAPKADQPKVGYFSMEYGLHISLRLYSGGLGVLAGDYLKEASDSNANFAAVGLLYRYGYFNQAIALNGDQIHQFPPQEFTKLPITPMRDEQGEWLKIKVGLAGRMVSAKIWVLQVGRVPLYLLDTDFEENTWEDRSLTHQLYGGNNEHRLKQEILLGIGGVRALKALGIKADIYHCNEGHAAFLSLERLKNYIQQEGMSYDEALEVVRSSSLFTTHTPVPAGHDHFPENLLQTYLYHYAHDLGISWADFMALGKVNAADSGELFSMSHLAIRLSQEVNGVSRLHGAVSQKMFNVLYPGYTPEELHVGYVTNSVHYPTWIADEWRELYDKAFGKAYLSDQSNKAHWRKIHQVDDEVIMSLRHLCKRRLLAYVRSKLQSDMARRGASPRSIFESVNQVREDALVLGFARRFATYKRAQLLFTNLDRLRAIVNNPDRPVMFIFAGKAHPADGGGQDLIRHIIHVSKQPEFAGKVIFLEDYNMEMAKLLVQGVDIWLNMPTRPMEASGTSGMKATLNGVVNFSVLDGWWAEGYRPDGGWALPEKAAYEDPNLQNELDAETIYNILETDIVPTYFDRNDKGISPRWVSFIKNNIAEIAPEFTMKRMLDDYYDRFYNKLFQRLQKVRAGNYALAKELAQWKQTVRKRWDGLHALEVEAFDSSNHALPVGETFTAEIKLFLSGIPAQNVGVEVVFFKRLNEKELEMKQVHAFQLVETQSDVARYRVSVDPHLAGVYEYGFRVFPQHPAMPHRQELNLVHWA